MELSHAEVWDDSALINAWDSALEEYKVWIYALPRNLLPLVNNEEVKLES